ncbi:MAG: TonB-dependent receptor plug domain-containing protein [Woeseia sp.]
MSRKPRRWRHYYGWSLLLASLSLIAPAQAQDTVGAEDEIEEITVTGSKLRRDEFSSISPVQVIGGQDAVRIGTIDVTQMIAESPFVFGTQLDGSVNSGSTTGAVEGVPASGPGSATVALRGLGPERTLMLVNGRRLAPSGVRGAPVAPDLNLIPSAMIDRIELLTDGASSIYGADAVAGVANIILRSEFEGIEVRGFGMQPEQSGGEESLISFIGGASNDRSNFTVAAEYFDRAHIFARDRTDWNTCMQDIEVAPDGTHYAHCLDRRPDNSVFINSAVFVYHTPGVTDIGVMDWSDDLGAQAFLGYDANTSVLVGSASETPYNLQQEELDTQLQGDVERINLYATGKYEVTPGHTVYVEGSYSQRQNADIFTSEQAFPAIPNMIPQEDASGNLVVDPLTGALVLVDNPLNPFDNEPRALPVYSLQGLSQERETDIDNFRIVAGIEGELGGQWFSDRNWIYDAFASFEESSGSSTQAGMNEFHIRESIDTLRMDASGNLVCGLPRTAAGFGFLTPADCVVVNWFAPSLFTTGGGDKTFATQEEEDFLFGNVINTTEIDQQHYSALITGDLFEMPAGTVGLVIGFEYRENTIDSENDIIRKMGLSASEAPDIEGDTNGTTWIRDVYVETELPLHEMFTANLSGRYTEEKNFGNEATYSVKAEFTPTEWLRLRGTAGTTFRAPNLREQFLAGQAGVISGLLDPCVVPPEASTGGVYDPLLDPRSQTVLDNCVLDGTDPTALGLQANVLIPTQTGGSDTISAETSDSFTLGFVLSQPFTEAFDFDFALTYFDIEVEDTVEELDPVTILTRCYNDDPNLANALCSRITRRGVNPDNNTIAEVDSSFVNLGLVTSKGYDINVRYLDDFTIGGRGFDVAASLTATQYDELFEQIDPEFPGDDRVGEAGFPEWSWILRADFNSENWGISWRTRYVGDFSKDADDVNLSTNSSRRNACLVLGGPVDPAGGNGPCVKKHDGDSTVYHDLSATYERDEWSITLGIRNVTDEEPPLITQGEGPSRFNHVVMSTYDLYGRRVFLNAQRRF